MTISDPLTGVAARYGEPDLALPFTTPTIDVLLAHRSVRRFLPDPVTDEELTAIVAAAQSSPSSSNLQTTSVVAVRDPERKARLAALTRGNRFIESAPLFLVWVADFSRARRVAERAGTSVDAADYLESTLIGFVDAGLAVQGAITAAESLGLGTCCVGGVRNSPLEIADELGLPDGAFPVVGLAVGRPDPVEVAGVKPRLPQSVVVHHEQYDADDAAGIAAYDDRAAAYNEAVGMTGAWCERVLTRLAGPQSMSGRDAMRAWLEKRGLPSL